MEDVTRTIFANIFTSFINLQCLNFLSSSTEYVHLSFDGKPPNVLSSVLTELHINLGDFDDCLYLLDGYFNQLRVLNVAIDSITYSSVIINNSVSYSIRRNT